MPEIQTILHPTDTTEPHAFKGIEDASLLLTTLVRRS
jgi:hypothetical protein